MTINVKYNFDDSADYTFDSTYVEVASGHACLKLAPVVNQTFNEDFSDDTGFTYDNTKAEFSGGAVLQKSQRIDDATWGATYTSSIDGNWGDSSTLVPVSSVGSPVVNANYLELIGGKNIIYDTGSCYAASIGAIKFKLKTNYSGSPSAIQQFVYFANPTAGDSANRLYLQQVANGQLWLIVHDENGVVQGTFVFGAWAPVANQEYEFELNWDYVAGEQRLFIDGVQFGSTFTEVTTRTTLPASSEVRLGGAAATADYSISQLVMFDAVQHTANYTPGYSLVETDYAENTVTLPAFVYSGEGNIQVFEDIIFTGSAPVRWIINGKYWDGGAWVISDDSFSQASSQADINANIGSLQVSNNVIVKLVFGDSNNQYSVSNLDFNYTGQAYFDEKTIVPNTGIPITAMSTFETSQTEPSGSSVKYQMSIDATYYWFNGGSWIEATDLTHSNTVAEVVSGLNDLPIASEGSFVKPRAVFFTDGAARPIIDYIDLGVTYDINPVDKPPRNIIYGSLLDIIGQNMTNKAWLRIVNDDQFFIDGNSIQPGETQAVANSEGVAAVVVVSTASVNYKYSFYIDYLDKNGVKQTKSLGKAVAPDNTSTNISTLTFEVS